jgi:hypothetical protein
MNAMQSHKALPINSRQPGKSDDFLTQLHRDHMDALAKLLGLGNVEIEPYGWWSHGIDTASSERIIDTLRDIRCPQDDCKAEELNENLEAYRNTLEKVFKAGKGGTQSRAVLHQLTHKLKELEEERNKRVQDKLENARSESVPVGSSEINERPRKSIREIFFGDIDQEDQPKTEKFVLRFELHRQKKSTSDVKKEESVINRNSFLGASDLYAEGKWRPTTNSSDVKEEDQDSEKDMDSAHANISILEAQLDGDLNLSFDSAKSNSTKALKGVEEVAFDEILQMCDLSARPLDEFDLFQPFIKLKRMEGILEQKIVRQPNLVKENEALEIVKNTLGKLDDLSELVLSQHQEAQPPEENWVRLELSIIHEEDEDSSSLGMNDLQSSSIASTA